MDYFDFEEASHAIPDLDLDTTNDASFPDAHDEQQAKAELEAQRTEHVPNPFSNTGRYGTTIRLKMINNREVDAILWDHHDGSDYPMFRAKEACQLCSQMGLDCFLASRGALISGCTCCITLWRECSFTHAQMPKGYIATMPGIAEDVQICQGSMNVARAPKLSEEAKGRKTGSRFPRDAVKILKRWLAEHADHPYPNEREKDELKDLTGLKRSQIANWLANARRRGKVRAVSGPSSPMLGAIDVPQNTVEIADLNPLDRWKVSPPEHEPALMTDIARAMATVPARKTSNPSLRPSRASSRKASSEEDSNWSQFRAPSVSSFETRESSNSDFSFASSRSHNSRASHASSLDRRRRRRAPMTQRAVAQTTKSKTARIFQCTFCTDSFPTKYDWQRHEKSLHLALERWVCCPNGATIQMPGTEQYRCAFCQELNPSEDHLETHNFSACNEKSLQERTFYRKDHLRQHLKLMHETKFSPSMEAWKSTTTEIRSRCGFCPSKFTTWQQRADHLVAHFRNGSDMKQWSGNWGFEPHIEKLVENAVPAYLNGHERSTMNPYVAKLTPKSHSATPGLSTGSSPNESEKYEVDQMARDCSCWHRLEQELTKWILGQKALGMIPSDKEIQDYGRMIIYGDSDPLDSTMADSPIWLAAFRYQMGIGPCPPDVNCQRTDLVPVSAPYAVKGGLKGSRTIAEMPCTKDLCSTPAENPLALPAESKGGETMGMEFDFDSMNFDGLETEEFNVEAMNIDGLALGSDFVLDNPYGQVHGMNGVFGPLDMSLEGMGTKGHETIMSERDLNELTRYMAGFSS